MENDQFAASSLLEIRLQEYTVKLQSYGINSVYDPGEIPDYHAVLSAHGAFLRPAGATGEKLIPTGHEIEDAIITLCNAIREDWERRGDQEVPAQTPIKEAPAPAEPMGS